MSCPEDFYEEFQYEDDDVSVYEEEEEEDEENEELSARSSSSHAGHDSGYEPSPPGTVGRVVPDRFTFSRSSTPSTSTSDVASGATPFGSPLFSSRLAPASSNATHSFSTYNATTSNNVRTNATTSNNVRRTSDPTAGATSSDTTSFISDVMMLFQNSLLGPRRSGVSPFAIYRAFRDHAASGGRRTNVQNVATQTSPTTLHPQGWQADPGDSDREEDDAFWPPPSGHPLPDLLCGAPVGANLGRGRGRSMSLPTPAAPREGADQEIGQTLRLLSDHFEAQRAQVVARRRRTKSES